MCHLITWCPSLPIPSVILSRVVRTFLPHLSRCQQQPIRWGRNLPVTGLVVEPWNLDYMKEPIPSNIQHITLILLSCDGIQLLGTGSRRCPITFWWCYTVRTRASMHMRARTRKYVLCALVVIYSTCHLFSLAYVDCKRTASDSNWPHVLFWYTSYNRSVWLWSQI